MKKLLIVANWKSNKTNVQAQQWLELIASKVNAFPSKEHTEIVVCAPFTSLSVLQWNIANQKLPLSLGAQNVSQFENGPYTGEINAQQIAEVARWVIIGHSERRKNFGETDKDLAQKVLQAKAADLKVIFCVPDASTSIPGEVDVVAYEPQEAIGTGNADSPEHADSVISQIKLKAPEKRVLYGGSVTPENISSFVEATHVDGVLVGSASLEAEKFAQLISHI